jgi:hypothetical protein
MPHTWTNLVRVGAMLLVALHGTAHATSPVSADTGLRTQLDQLSRLRIFFGHQSVGGNLLDGVQKSLAASPGSTLRVVEVKEAGVQLAPGTWAHAMVGENTKPESKLVHFAQLMDGGLAEQADVAFMTFCHVDFDAHTDAQALFARYRTTLDGLKARHPGTTFVHVTVPLTTVQQGVKGWFKHLLGRSTRGEQENLRRESFNTLLRDTYGGKEPLFDLAHLESVAPNGTTETFEAQGRTWPALSRAYAADEGHLNAVGQAQLSAKLIAFLAALPQPARATPSQAQAAPATP